MQFLIEFDLNAFFLSNSQSKFIINQGKSVQQIHSYIEFIRHNRRTIRII